MIRFKNVKKSFKDNDLFVEDKSIKQSLIYMTIFLTTVYEYQNVNKIAWVEKRIES